eukprot:TRINITY_DN5731_c0_g1_i6.p1 TRINITY_DN5731_c0_g1~~TRINITY_DN5731_c0_g1_i6.p1  ORF type:complete len:392 (-),score=104.27 TRINITY_DN5731_c0_g1_i6:233-1408(-)
MFARSCAGSVLYRTGKTKNKNTKQHLTHNTHANGAHSGVTRGAECPAARVLCVLHYTMRRGSGEVQVQALRHMPQQARAPVLKRNNSRQQLPAANAFTFNVVVVEATGLRACDYGTSDPYVQLMLLSKNFTSTAKTRYINKNLSPTWNEEFTFLTDSPEEDLLQVTVFDHDSFVANDVLGVCQVSLQPLLTEDSVDLWRELTDPSDTRHSQGFIHLIMRRDTAAPLGNGIPLATKEESDTRTALSKTPPYEPPPPFSPSYEPPQRPLPQQSPPPQFVYQTYPAQLPYGGAPGPEPMPYAPYGQPQPPHQPLPPPPAYASPLIASPPCAMYFPQTAASPSPPAFCGGQQFQPPGNCFYTPPAMAAPMTPVTPVTPVYPQQPQQQSPFRFGFM